MPLYAPTRQLETFKANRMHLWSAPTRRYFHNYSSKPRCNFDFSRHCSRVRWARFERSYPCWRPDRFEDVNRARTVALRSTDVCLPFVLHVSSNGLEPLFYAPSLYNYPEAKEEFHRNLSRSFEVCPQRESWSLLMALWFEDGIPPDSSAALLPTKECGTLAHVSSSTVVSSYRNPSLRLRQSFVRVYHEWFCSSALPFSIFLQFYDLNAYKNLPILMRDSGIDMCSDHKLSDLKFSNCFCLKPTR